MKTTTKLNRKIGNIPCRVAGCDAPGFISRNAEAMHYNRVHSGLIKVPREGQNKKRASAPVLQTDVTRNGHTHTDEPVKRKYTKRRKYKMRQTRKPRQKQEPFAVTVHVSYCPIDGTDMMAVAAVLLLKGIKKPVVSCPTCHTDLRGVAEYLAKTNPNSAHVHPV